MIEPRYLDLLQDLSTDQSAHSGRTLLDHLKGTYGLLEKWGNPKDVCVAGLFHSIYGTEYYRVRSADPADRKVIIDAIGSPSEQLVFLFCTTDRIGFFTEAENSNPVLVDRATKTPVPVSVAILSALIEIEVANYVEQLKPDNVSPRLVELMRHMLTLGRPHMTKKAGAALAQLVQRGCRT